MDICAFGKDNKKLYMKVLNLGFSFGTSRWFGSSVSVVPEVSDNMYWWYCVIGIGNCAEALIVKTQTKEDLALHIFLSDLNSNNEKIAKHEDLVEGL